ncbi:hypothetical protein ACP70R_046419 [Stipagrostis hirtigluma subsp. patula]
MPVWSQVDPVATVAQLAGVDAYGLIALIVQRAEAVRRNRHECQELAQQVETIGFLLPQVLREHPEIDRVMGRLERTLQEACDLVSSCQGSSYLRRFLRSGKQAEQFRRMKEKIDFYLQIFPVISHIDTTRRLARIIDEESPQTQNTRSSSNRSGHVPRSKPNDDYSFERPQARTEPFAIHRDETAGVRSQGVGASSSNDNGHQLTRGSQGLIAPGFLLFEFSQLARATKNFSREYKIGEGGFGRVYKAQVQGLPAAIKRCFIESSPERLSDFENEIKFIPKLQHINILWPRTWASLNWDTLFGIIGGIAQGVVYLHLHCGLSIIHRDLKPSNILLDSDMNPKISDFGTARAGHPDKTQKADVIAGTRGYMAPEYSNKGIFSGKTDVFSFGSLLLEILSGKRNGTSYSIGNHKSLSLHEYAWNVVFAGKAPLTKLIHPSLYLHSEASQVKRCAHIALLCVQEDPADRPSMWEVLLMLNGDAATAAGLPTPKKPSRRYGGAPRFADFLRDEREWYKKTVTVVMR